MYYKNISNTVKRFYDVTFLPGEAKEVDGIVNAKGMIQVKELPASAAPDTVALSKTGKKDAKKKDKTDDLALSSSQTLSDSEVQHEELNKLEEAN